jgi:hypothetical protein
MSGLFDDLRAHVAQGDVLVIAGAGISVGATRKNPLASWTGLLEQGVDRCREVATGLPPDWGERLRAEIRSTDLDDLLSAAEKISRKLGAPKGGEYKRWLRETVGSLKATDRSVLEALRDLQLPLATTNYDGLLEDVTQWPAFTWRQSADVERVLRGHDQGVLHLHGRWRDSESVILGIRSYEQIVDDEHAQAVLRAARTVKTLLFVGFGLGLRDPNFHALFEWTCRVFGSSEYRHYRLALEQEVVELQKQHSSAERIFVLSYGRRHADLAGFLRQLMPATVRREGRSATTRGHGRTVAPTFGLDQELQFLADESRFTYRGCICTGNWEPDTRQGRTQWTGVPVALAQNPEKLNFGPGWCPSFPSHEPGWETFERHLDESGGIDLTRCEAPTPEERDAWRAYRFRGILALPRIRVVTHADLPILTSRCPALSKEAYELLREHLLIIENGDPEPLHDLCLRVDLPEGVLDPPQVTRHPPGVDVLCEAESITWRLILTPAGQFQVICTSTEAPRYRIMCSHLPAKSRIELGFLSIPERAARAQGEAADRGGRREPRQRMIEGSFRFQWRDVYFARSFTAALSYTPETRVISVMASQEGEVKRESEDREG